MRVIKEISIDDRKVLVKELTLEEIHAWLQQATQRMTLDLVDELFGDQDVMIPDIPSFSDISENDLRKLAPSEIAPLVAMIREVNARFFATWQRRLAESRALMGVAPTGSPAALPA